MTKALSCLLVLLTLVLAPPRSAAAPSPLAVVIHTSRAKAVGPLNAVTLEAIFSRRKQFWNDGTRIVAFNHPENSPLRSEFDRAVLGLEPAAATQYWVDQKVRGGPRPPLKVSSTAVLVRSLKVMKAGIGYLKLGEVTPGLHVVALIRDGKVLAP